MLKNKFNYSFLELPRYGRLMLCSLPRLEEDFLRIKQEAQALLSLTQRVVSFFEMRIIHLPIQDYHAPTYAQWEGCRAPIEAILTQGGTLAIHCHAGLGRTGTLAALILIEQGLLPQEAMNKVREVRSGAIETPLQEEFLRSLRF